MYQLPPANVVQSQWPGSLVGAEPAKLINQQDLLDLNKKPSTNIHKDHHKTPPSDCHLGYLGIHQSLVYPKTSQDQAALRAGSGTPPARQQGEPKQPTDNTICINL